MNSLTVKASDWPTQANWPKAGWKHTLNSEQFSIGSIFGWNEDSHLWTGIVEERGACSVKVRNVLPGVLQ